VVCAVVLMLGKLNRDLWVERMVRHLPTIPTGNIRSQWLRLRPGGQFLNRDPIIIPGQMACILTILIVMGITHSFLHTYSTSKMRHVYYV